MTKKAEQQIDTTSPELPKVTYDQKLMNNIKELEKNVQKSANETQQLLGALDYARFAYSEYMKEITPPKVDDIKE